MNIPAQPLARERGPTAERLGLTLFVSGTSPASTRAVSRLRDICDRHCPSGYDLKVVDIYQEPVLVVSRGVLAVPTLIRDRPLPVRLLVGDFTNEPRVVAALGLQSAVTK